MKWWIIIAAVLLFSLYGHDVVLGILATIIVACIFVICWIRKNQKKQAQEDAELQEQIAVHRQQLETEKLRAELDKVKAENAALKKAQQEPQPEPEAKRFSFLRYPVKGVFKHEDDIFHKLMAYNSFYDYTEAELIEYGETDSPVYKWVPKDLPAELVPEPSNPYDPNAIRVEIGGIAIGYIPKENCIGLLSAMSHNKIENVAYTTEGGAYKLVEEEYDFEKDRSKYTYTTGKAELSAEVCVKVRNE
jgi:cell division protein FtsB